MIFEITKEQQEKINLWFENLKPQILEVMEERKIPAVFGDGEPYYGAIGGGITYHITPNSIGFGITVEEYYTGEKLDITDYDSW
jgi:hypothetical protein